MNKFQETMTRLSLTGYEDPKSEERRAQAVEIMGRIRNGESISPKKKKVVLIAILESRGWTISQSESGKNTVMRHELINGVWVLGKMGSIRYGNSVGTAVSESDRFAYLWEVT